MFDLKLYFGYLSCWTVLCILLPGVPHHLGFYPLGLTSRRDQAYYALRALLLLVVAAVNAYHLYVEALHIRRLSLWLYFSSIWSGLKFWGTLLVGLVFPLEVFSSGDCFADTKSAICNVVQADMAVASVILAIKLLYFLRGDHNNRGFLVSLILYVMRDMASFFYVLLVVLFGFSLSFFALMDKSSMVDGDDHVSSIALAENYGKQIITLFSNMLGEVELDALYDSSFWFLAVPLFLAYMTIVAIIFFNVLIAVISDSFDRIMAARDRLSNLEKAMLLVEKERVMPAKELRRWAPRWLHVLYPRDQAPPGAPAAAGGRGIIEGLNRRSKSSGNAIVAGAAGWEERLRGQIASQVSVTGTSIVQELGKEIAGGMLRLESKIDAMEQRQRVLEHHFEISRQDAIPESKEEEDNRNHSCRRKGKDKENPEIGREEHGIIKEKEEEEEAGGLGNDGLELLRADVDAINNRVEQLSVAMETKLDRFLADIQTFLMEKKADERQEQF